MNRKQFLDGYREHVKELREKDIYIFEGWMWDMQRGVTLCPFVYCKPDYLDSEEAKYYDKYRHPWQKDNVIACQMVQVYCEERFE